MNWINDGSVPPPAAGKDESALVLVVARHSSGRTAGYVDRYLHDDRDWLLHSSFGGNAAWTVTHWMPYPELPEENNCG